MAEKKFELKSGNKPTFFNMGSYSHSSPVKKTPDFSKKKQQELYANNPEYRKYLKDKGITYDAESNTSTEVSPLNQKCYEGTCPDFSVKGSKTGRKIKAWWERTKKKVKKKRAIRESKRKNKLKSFDAQGGSYKNPRYL